MEEKLRTGEAVSARVRKQETKAVGDEMKVAGTVHIDVVDGETGQIRLSATAPNLVTYGGMDAISSAIAQASAGQFNYVAISGSNVSHSAGSTTLTGEITLGLSPAARGQATYSHTTAASTYSLSYTWTATTAFVNIQQGGTFDQVTSGRMSFVSTFSSVSLNSNDQLTLTWFVRVV